MASSHPAEGNLSVQDVDAVVGSLCTRGWTGALVLSHAGATRTLHFEGGRLVSADSTHPDDRVATRLLATGRLSLADHAALPGSAAEAALLERGLVKASDLRRVEVEVAEQIVARALASTQGTYRMDAAATRGGLDLGRSTAELLLDAVSRVESWSRVESLLGGSHATYRRSERYEDVLSELRLPFEKLSILMDLHGERTVASVCAESSVPDFEVCRLLLAFRLLGAIVRVDEPTRVEAPVDDDGLGDVLDEEEEDAAEEIATAAPLRQRVLLVAVDPDLVARLEPMFSRSAFLVERAADGAAGLAACARARFDLVMISDAVTIPPLGPLLEQLNRTGAAAHVIVAAAEAEVDGLRRTLGESARLAVVARDPAQLLEEVACRLLGAARRVATRLLVRIQVKVQASRQLVLLQTDNVSTTGMLLRTDQQFPVGTTVTLEFQLPGDRHPIVGDGEVVRHTAADVEKGRGIGIRYSGFRGDGQQRLEAYLAGLVTPR